MATKWSAFLALGNGWQSQITNATVVHKVKDPSTGNELVETLGPVVLAAGQVSASISVTAFEGEDDKWTIQFTDAAGTTHSADLTANIKTEDAGGIVFTQVTNQNDRVTLYFPVSSDSHTGI